ncbi:MAG: ankyrin repeat domain-containing protein [Treponema sp.]|nr:ankyrin repeat domain-containing protein [Treponema sp.]
MKKFFAFCILIFSFALLFATPWGDNLFVLVETDTAKNIQRAIETDYSFKDFTRTKEKENLLMAALKNARGNDVIDLLLHEAQISPDSKTKSGVTAFMYACQYETDIEAVKNMLSTEARSDAKKAKRILTRDKEGLTSFDYARKNESISLEVLELLNMYAQEPVAEVQEEIPEEPVEEVQEVEETPEEEPQEEVGLEDSAEIEEEEEVEEPAEVTPPPPEKNALLDLASLSSPALIPESIYLYDYADDKHKNIEIPESLIAAEQASKNYISDANKRDSQGKTKLMIAARDGDIPLIENLLYSGAEINAKDEDGWTALMYAARFQKDADVTKLLLYKGADRAIKNKYGITALLLSAGYSENPEVVSTLLETYNQNSDEAREAFAYGISNLNTPEVLQAFINKKVPLNIPFNGKTPLMLACQTGKNTELIEWLLKSGASKYQIDSATGKTAFDYAKENKKLPHNVTYWSLNPNS